MDTGPELYMFICVIMDTGPEFGGSIGVIFFFANVFASGLYIVGFVDPLQAPDTTCYLASPGYNLLSCKPWAQPVIYIQPGISVLALPSIRRPQGLFLARCITLRDP